VLQPADLATNKASAAADRRVSRDIVDLVTIHERILPLGAAITAAVGRFPGMTPDDMLAEIRRHGTFTADEFEALATEKPLEPREMHNGSRRCSTTRKPSSRDGRAMWSVFCFLRATSPCNLI
jgi:hypothetical protein